MTRLDPAARAYYRELREQREWAERIQKRQMRGNVFTSLAQQLATNRPLQVATALGTIAAGRAVVKIAEGVNKSGALTNYGDPRFRQGWKDVISSAFTGLEDLAIVGGMVAYLGNSDGGSSVSYDVPDVETPGPGGIVPPQRTTFRRPGAQLPPARRSTR